MDQPNLIQSAIDKPLFTPVNLNIEYVFGKVYEVLLVIWNFVVNSDTWTVIGVISSLVSILCIAIIIFSLVRLFEIQEEEAREIDHEIHEAIEKSKEKERGENPRWHYILTLSESPNESDWRVAVLEADNMMEEVLQERGFAGETVSELLEAASGSGFLTIQNVWEAHNIRNQVAHEGSEFPLSQIEGRRVIRMYQTFFEELSVI